VAGDYVKMLKVCYKAVKEVDPGSKVVGLNACNSGTSWPETCLKLGAGEYFDIFAYHDYYEDNPNIWVKKRRVEQLKDLMSKYNIKDKPLWCTEIGAVFVPRENAIAMPMTEEEFKKRYKNELIGTRKDFIKSSGPIQFPEHRVTCWNLQSFLMEFASGSEKIFLYCGLKFPWGQKDMFYVHEHGVAFSALAKVITNRKTIKYLDTGNDNTNGILVTDKNGKKTAILWAASNFAEEVPITLLVRGNDKYKGMDMFGNPLSFEAKNNLLSVKLTQDLIYIFDVNEDIKGIEIVKVKGDSLINTENVYKGELVITNPNKNVLKGEIKITLPKDFEI
jgi:hypothetical protein